MYTCRVGRSIHPCIWRERSRQGHGESWPTDHWPLRIDCRNWYASRSRLHEPKRGIDRSLDGGRVLVDRVISVDEQVLDSTLSKAMCGSIPSCANREARSPRSIFCGVPHTTWFYLQPGAAVFCSLCARYGGYGMLSKGTPS
jgi:hypothetical protein